MSAWIATADRLPSEGLIVETKLANPDRNLAKLKRRGRLWFVEDGSMYVYYTPSHWRSLTGVEGLLREAAE